MKLGISPWSSGSVAAKFSVGGLSQPLILLLQQQQIFCILYEAYGSIIDILVFDAVAVIASYQTGYAAACVGLIHCWSWIRKVTLFEMIKSWSCGYLEFIWCDQCLTELTEQCYSKKQSC